MMKGCYPMLNLELLEELVAFQEFGTLSATAEHLMLTQPTVTRGMKKLEQELGVTLFDRSKSNRIVLNDTGVLAANEAKKLLQAENDFTEKILNYDRLKHEITVASLAPGPLMLLEAIKDKLNSKLSINHSLLKSDKIVADLTTFKEKIIFTDQELETDEVESMYLGKEYLAVEIDQFNPLAAKKKVSFKDLAGLSFIVVADIGPWRKIVEDNIPEAKFLYQDDLDALSELSKYSNFPFFYTNLTQASSVNTDRFDNGNRVHLTIDDPNNELEIYGTYLKSNRKLIQPLLKEISKNWPK